MAHKMDSRHNAIPYSMSNSCEDLPKLSEVRISQGKPKSTESVNLLGDIFRAANYLDHRAQAATVSN